MWFHLFIDNLQSTCHENIIISIAGTHLIHGDGIVLGQHLFQRICHTGKLQLVWRLAVDIVTQYLCCSLAFFHIQRPYGDPANASHPLEVCFIDILCKEKRQTLFSKTKRFRIKMQLKYIVNYVYGGCGVVLFFESFSTKKQFTVVDKLKKE